MSVDVVSYAAVPEAEAQTLPDPETLHDDDLGRLLEAAAPGLALSPSTLAILARLFRDILTGLKSGSRLLVLSEEKELTPNQISEILGISRPLVVHRMETGELAFRMVNTHRRATLRDVLKLKEREDRRKAAGAVIAADAEDLERLAGADAI